MGYDGEAPVLLMANATDAPSTSLARAASRDPPGTEVAPDETMLDGTVLDTTPVLLDDAIMLDAAPLDPSAASPDSSSVPLEPLFRIVTPFHHEAWREELYVAGLLDRFAHVPMGICSGFDVGLPREKIDAYFARTGERFRLYKNHKTAMRHPEVIEKMLEEELAEGRISHFMTPDELYARMGHFRNAPLTIAAKDSNFAKGRVCQDFSYPRDDPMDISFNASLDRSGFSCDWGTFAQCYLLAADAPAGTQVAVFDVKAAHRRIPVTPWQQPFMAIMWKNKVALDYCTQFGEASASDTWGTTADAFRGIFHHRHSTSRTINWADDFTFWRYPNLLGIYDLEERDIYALADILGWPWSQKKTLPFSHRFPYLGFTWDLRNRSVEVTESKKTKYLTAIAPWVPGAAMRQKDGQSVLGKLVHCSMVLPEGRSRLPALSKFCAAFTSGNPHVTHKVPQSVLDDIAWWRVALSSPFCGMDIVKVPEPHPTRVYVDASTTFGIGIVIDDHWDFWRFKDGWRADRRDIGWAEMAAIELGMRALVERRLTDVHIRIWSDNQGVVGALDAGKSRNAQTNRILQRVVSWMVANSMWLSVRWICSEDNPADAPSRGLPAQGKLRFRHKFKIPFLLRDWVEKMPLYKYSSYKYHCLMTRTRTRIGKSANPGIRKQCVLVYVMIPKRTWRRTMRIHDSALAASTRASYKRAVARFMDWAAAERIPRRSWFPTSEPLACAYAASFAGVYSAGAARSAIAALHYFHDRNGWSWPSSGRLSRILSAVQTHAPLLSSRDPRPPVTLGMLDIALKALDFDRGFDLCVATAMLTVFWGQMRLGEALATTREYDFSSLPAVKHLTLRAAAGGPATQETTALWLPKTKTARRGDWVWLAKHHNDPSFALQCHIHENNIGPNDPLFAYRVDGTEELRPLTKSAFLSRLNEIWSPAGVCRITGHCFRIGGTTALLRAGVPPEVVKVAGRWKSDSFLRYWRAVDSIISEHIDLCDMYWRGGDRRVASF